MTGATEQRPVYSASREALPQHDGTQLWCVWVDEGWRSTIVCSGMYQWAAEWLVEQLQGKPYASETRP